MNARDFLTPEELMQRYPQVITLGWCSSKIGMFYNSGLLIGHRSGRESKALILESSFIELMEYVNQVTEKKHLKF